MKWEGPPVERPDGTVRSQLHLGAFRTEKEARTRERWARDEWAAGRVPDPKRIVLAKPSPLIRTVAPEWLASRIDLSASSILQYQSRIDRINDDLGSIPIGALSTSDVRRWVRDLVVEFQPATVSVYVVVLRQILDYADVDPNPARHRSVKMPRGYTKNSRIRLPSTPQLAAIRARIGPEHRRLLDFLEDTGARIAEACALDWKDVHRDRVVVRGTKRASSIRIVRADTHPIRLLAEERHAAGLVFEIGPSAMRAAMASSDPSGHFSPHDLRHLHASRLLEAGVSPPVIAERLGHGLPTLLKTYGHVVPPD